MRRFLRVTNRVGRELARAQCAPASWLLTPTPTKRPRILLSTDEFRP